ncbi:MAG: glycosyl hydrolase [Oscillospiraceae bacterium]
MNTVKGIKMLKVTALILVVNMFIASLGGCENNPDSTDAADSAPTAGDVVNEKVELCNPNATPEAQRVYEYVNEMYKQKIISGQQESTWMGTPDYEMEHILKASGKLPAIRGLDYMHMDFDGVNKRAVEWWEKGGIVTICWHCGSDFTGEWTDCMQDEITDWDKALTEGTPEYDTLIKGMDMGAKALLELQEAGVPVLWRPFHELNGHWFWWSKGGADNFKTLWKIMYDRYTNHWGLNNLIWVFGYSHSNGVINQMEDWYVGDEYCDIVGADSYDKGSNAKLYNAVVKFIGDRKPVCFHECGTIPTVNELNNDKAMWCYFMTWHTSYITDENTASNISEIYNSDYVITLDELPSFMQ